MNRTVSRIGSLLPLVVLTAGVAIAGCKKPVPPKTGDDTGTTAPTSSTSGTSAPRTTPREDVATPESGSVNIERKILTACGDIPEARFAFNSTAIEGSAAKSLEALARCFVDGALKGRAMKLVGHTDPRGTTTYNYGLGQRRADSVSSFLQGKKLLASQVATSSVGENDAAGVDEDGWSKDRRVDVFLAE